MDDDLTDEELPGYALIHCETAVAAFHKDHVSRLLSMAGQADKAAAVRDGSREFYYLGPGTIRPIVAKIEARKSTRAAGHP